MSANTAVLVGKKLRSVKLSEDNDKITFTLSDGTTHSFGVEGDCCSSSWIEHFEVPKGLRGATVLSVNDVDMEPHDGHSCEDGASGKPCGHDCLSVYHTQFRTDKGDIVLEYRNDSNGYYGGYLIDL